MASLQHHLFSSIAAPRLPWPSRLLHGTLCLRRLRPLTSAIDRHSPPGGGKDEPKAEVSRRQLIVGLQVVAAAAFMSSQPQSAALADCERVHLPIDPSVVLMDNQFVCDYLNHDVGDTLQLIPLNARLHGDMNDLAAADWTNTDRKEERPRFFDSKAKRLCWDKAEPVPGRDPDRWRIDAIGNIVCKRLHTCNGCLCYEFDHITPFSKGGQSIAENCQVLQTRVNRLKSDKGGLTEEALRGYSCNVRFDDEELDAIEVAVYGSINRVGKQCVVGSVVGPSLAKKKHFVTCS